MKTISIFLITLFMSMSVSAQTTQAKWKAPKRPKVRWKAPARDTKQDVIDVWRPYNVSDNWWIDAYGGTGMSFGENRKGHNITDLMGGLGGVAIGKQTSYLWSTRLAIEYASLYGLIAEGDVVLPDLIKPGKYKFGLAEMWLDERFSLTGATCRYNENRKINFNLFFGAGVSYSTGAEKATKYWELYSENGTYSVDRHSHINLGLRGGLQAQYAVAKAFDVWGQVAYNSLADNHNGLTHGGREACIELTAGLTIRLTDHYGDYRYMKTRRTEASRLRGNAHIDQYYKRMAAQQEAKINDERLEYGKTMRTKLAFYTDRYYITDPQMDNLRIVARFMQLHPDLNIVIRAYSGVSRNCETPNLNLAKHRAETVKKALIDNFGIDEQRLTLWHDESVKSPTPMRGEWIEAVEFEMAPVN